MAKHISLRYHFTRDLVENGTVALQYCQSGETTADILTKPLPRENFEMFRRELGMRSASLLEREWRNPASSTGPAHIAHTGIYTHRPQCICNVQFSNACALFTNMYGILVESTSPSSPWVDVVLPSSDQEFSWIVFHWEFMFSPNNCWMIGMANTIPNILQE